MFEMGSTDNYNFTIPLSLVTVQNSTQFELRKENLDTVLSTAGSRKLFVLSIVGPKDTGKSLLLGYIARYLAALENNDSDWLGWVNPDKPVTDFHWDNKKSPNIFGTWIHNRAFIIKLDEPTGNESDVAVILLYTQCPHPENWSESRFVHPLIGLTTYISSFTVFNVHADLDEDVIVGIGESLKYSLFKHQHDSHLTTPPLKKLAFLIRDWCYPCEYPYGITGGNNFIKIKLSPKKDHSAKSWTSRNLMDSMFEDTTACLLPYPGNCVFSRNFGGSLEQLEDIFPPTLCEFIGHVVDLQEIREQLQSQTSGLLTAQELKDRLGEYIGTLNALNMPDTSLKKLVQLSGKQHVILVSEIKNLIADATKEYEKEFAKREQQLTWGQPFASETTLKQVHRRATEHAAEFLQENFEDATTDAETLDPMTNDIEAHKQYLSELLEVVYSRVKSENFKKKKAFLKTLTSEGIMAYKKGRKSPIKSKDVVKDLLEKKLGRRHPDFNDTLTWLKEEIKKEEGDFSGDISNHDERKDTPSPAFGKGCRKLNNARDPKESPVPARRSFQKITNFKPEWQMEQEQQNDAALKLIEKLTQQHKDLLSRHKNPTYSELERVHDTHLSKILKDFDQTFFNVRTCPDIAQHRRTLDTDLENAFLSAWQNKKAPDDQEETVKTENLADIASDYEQKLQEFINSNVFMRDQELETFNQDLLSTVGVNKGAGTELNKIFERLQRKKNRSVLAIQMELANLKRESKEDYVTSMKAVLNGDEVTHTKIRQSHDDIKARILQKFTTSANLNTGLPLFQQHYSELDTAMEIQLTDLKSKFAPKIVNDEDTKNGTLRESVSFYNREMEKSLDGLGFINFPDLQLLHDSIVSRAALQFNRQKKVDGAEFKTALDGEFVKFKDQNAMELDIEDAIGIDLGTTFSCASVYRKGKITIIPNAVGENTTPSYVYINPETKEEIVGQPAKDRAFDNPKETIFDAKRLIGRKFSDPVVQHDKRFWPFSVVDDGNDVPVIDINGERIHPESISAKVLAELKLNAEVYLGKPVTKAVITVPAYFGDGQRQATIDAGKIAGLEVLNILTEPVAAALAYKLQYPSLDDVGQSRNILVYDLGGGTFDVAVIQASAGEVTTLGLGGDSHLGGEDFDKNVMEYCVQIFKEEYGIDLFEGKESSKKTVKDDALRQIKRVQAECERQKINLASTISTEIVVNRLHDDKDLRVTLTRTKFEELNKSLFEKTLTEVKKTLRDAKLDKREIHDIVLVGGSTKIPKLQEMLRQFFNGKQLCRQINPDEAVAYGAGLQAATLKGNISESSSLYNKIYDITPISIGTKILETSGLFIKTDKHVFSVIIPKGSPIPSKREETYTTAHDNQTEMSVEILEGESSNPEENDKLGEFLLEGIPPKKKGKEDVVIKMEITAQGILHATAWSVSSGAKSSLTVTEHKKRLDEETKRKYMIEASKQEIERKRRLQNSKPVFP